MTDKFIPGWARRHGGTTWHRFEGHTSLCGRYEITDEHDLIDGPPSVDEPEWDCAECVREYRTREEEE